MISIAGGDDVAGDPGLSPPEVGWGELASLNAEVVIVMPRGSVEDAQAQAMEHWERIAALGAAAGLRRRRHRRLHRARPAPGRRRRAARPPAAPGPDRPARQHRLPAAEGTGHQARARAAEDQATARAPRTATTATAVIAASSAVEATSPQHASLARRRSPARTDDTGGKPTEVSADADVRHREAEDQVDHDQERRSRPASASMPRPRAMTKVAASQSEDRPRRTVA